MSAVKIECENCKAIHEIAVGDFAFEAVDSNEREMGAEIAYGATVEINCPCGKYLEVTHTFWEYPEGTENHRESSASGATILSNNL